MSPPGSPAPLDVLRSTVRDLVSLITGGVGRFDRVPAPGEWTAAMVLAHLADAELVCSVRLRAVLTSEHAQLASFDEEAWVQRFASLDSDPKQSLARWRPLREANLRLLDSLDEPEWALSGWQAGRGELSVARIAELLAAHDRRHLDQLRAVLALPS